MTDAQLSGILLIAIFGLTVLLFCRPGGDHHDE